MTTLYGNRLPTVFYFLRNIRFCLHCWVLNVPALYREIVSFTLMFVFMVFLLGRKKFEYEFNKI